jgi:hypothetical protein
MVLLALLKLDPIALLKDTYRELRELLELRFVHLMQGSETLADDLEDVLQRQLVLHDKNLHEHVLGWQNRGKLREVWARDVVESLDHLCENPEHLIEQILRLDEAGALVIVDDILGLLSQIHEHLERQRKTSIFGRFAVEERGESVCRAVLLVLLEKPLCLSQHL